MIKIEIDIAYMMALAMIVLAIAVLALLMFEIQYFVRMIFVLCWGIFEEKKKPDATTTIYGMCTTSDLDFVFKHMNNGRYVRELDFARIHFYERTGIYKAYSAKKGVALQAACVIRYRRPISLFTSYKITTKMIYWDEKSIYLEQQFISLKDDFVKAIAYSKQGFVRVNAAEIVTTLMDKDITYKSEMMSKELEHFIGCLDASSMRLRKKDE